MRSAHQIKLRLFSHLAGMLNGNKDWQVASQAKCDSQVPVIGVP